MSGLEARHQLGEAQFPLLDRDVEVNSRLSPPPSRLRPLRCGAEHLTESEINN